MFSDTPKNWYWLADDGRVFSSAVESVIPATDAAYTEWLAAGFTPTTWPSDDAGVQTFAELQRVLFSYRMAVDLKAYAFMVRDQFEHDGCTVGSVPGITETRTDPYTQNLITRYYNAAAANAAFVANWVLPDRSTVPLDKAKIDALFGEVSSFVASTYATYSQVIDDIDGGAITSQEQIDAAFGITLRRGDPPVDIGWKS